MYIGRSDSGISGRYQGRTWVDDEYDAMTIRLASVGPFTSWSNWETAGHYSKAAADLVSAIEARLIFAHQPSYSSQNKQSLAKAKGLRLVNSGRLGQLLPEVSYLYYNEDLPRTVKRDA